MIPRDRHDFLLYLEMPRLMKSVSYLPQRC